MTLRLRLEKKKGTRFSHLLRPHILACDSIGSKFKAFMRSKQDELATMNHNIDYITVLWFQTAIVYPYDFKIDLELILTLLFL